VDVGSESKRWLKIWVIHVIVSKRIVLKVEALKIGFLITVKPVK
jgi:hypothetical protein